MIAPELRYYLHNCQYLLFFIGVAVQPLSSVQLFMTSWTIAHQAPLSSTVSQSLFKFMYFESVMLSNHLILCYPLLLLPSIFPSITVFLMSQLFTSPEKAMATHSNTLAWTEEPGRLQPMGSLRVGHNWATSLSLFIFMHRRRKWQPTSGFLPGESQGRGSLVGFRLWGHTESDMTEVT